MIKILEDPMLKQFPLVGHAFFTRQGGVSSGQYSSLNCGYASKDDALNVRENRKRVASYFGTSLEAIATVKNVHGNNVIFVDEPWLEEERPEADAIVTRSKGVILGLESADCSIILFADVKAHVIGIAHAGWRGAKNGVLGSTVNAMKKLGATPATIVAAIGPSIMQNSYEVREDFYQQFMQDNTENNFYFKKKNEEGRFMFDLPGFIISRLTGLGLKKINFIGIDTYNDERFFSCRRSLHQGQEDFGRNFSCIYLR